MPGHLRAHPFDLQLIPHTRKQSHKAHQKCKKLSRKWTRSIESSRKYISMVDHYQAHLHSRFSLNMKAYTIKLFSDRRVARPSHSKNAQIVLVHAPRNQRLTAGVWEWRFTGVGMFFIEFGVIVPPDFGYYFPRSRLCSTNPKIDADSVFVVRDRVFSDQIQARGAFGRALILHSEQDQSPSSSSAFGASVFTIKLDMDRKIVTFGRPYTDSGGPTVSVDLPRPSAPYVPAIRMREKRCLVRIDSTRRIRE
eukprot:gnl/Dysnectes_brevis/7665_a13077_278.p1 GENE.gnl/Dysnectes_brevis/7665_a13077_278~~gnl/Dysnectes_brevis/7665_a13077_278.p1  ORF type:complete len:272 (+),score=-6.32 gnl/Dysnectes_brevis/7665_a13077_278:65-817(+)